MESASIRLEAMTPLEVIELSQHLRRPEGSIASVESVADQWIRDPGRSTASGKAHPEVPVRDMRQACIESAEALKNVDMSDHI